MLSPAIHDVLRVESFPVQPLGSVAACCQELATRNHVPVDLVALAMMTTASGLAGSRAQVDTGQGRLPAHLFSVVAAAPGSGAEAALRDILDPVVAIQQTLTNTSNNLDHQHLEEEAAKFRYQRYTYYQSSSSSQAGWAEYKIGEIRKALAPVITVSELGRPQLLQALEQSFDSCLFYFDSDDISTKLARKRGVNAIDLDLLSRCVNRQPIHSQAKPGVPGCIPSPGLSVFALTGTNGLAELLGMFDRLPAGLRRASVVYDCGAVPAKVNPAVLQPSQHLSDWKNQVTSLVRNRRESEGAAIQVKPEARVIIYKLHDAIVDLLPQAPMPVHEQLLAAPGLAWRLAACLHLLQQKCDIPMPPETAAAATAMARFYLCRQLTAWFGAQTAATQCQPHSEIELMLARIRVRGPISRRSLYRSYAKQSAAIHEPILCQLLSQGLVVQDGQGQLAINPTIEAGATDKLTH